MPIDRAALAAYCARRHGSPPSEAEFITALNWAAHELDSIAWGVYAEDGPN